MEGNTSGTATPASAPRRLADYSAEELRDMPYPAVLALRRVAYREHINAMPQEDRETIELWAAAMAEVYGPAIKVVHNALPWDIGFMVARHGEAIDHWPTTLDAGDRVRMVEWAKEPSKITRGVRVLGRTVQLRPNEALHGLEDFGSAITVRPADAAPPLNNDVLARMAAVAQKLGAKMDMSDFMESGIVTLVYRTGAGLAKPTSINHALYTAMPGETGGGTEVTGGSYARVNLAPLDANWAATAAGDGHTENLVAIQFAAPTANWGTIVGWAQIDQSGNFLMYGALAVNKTVNNGDAAPSFAIGALDITFS